MKTSTLCVHLPPGNDPYGATAPPIYQTATFRQPGATEFGEYDYSRTANPTRALAEQQIAALEGGASPAPSRSGMAALVAVTRLVKAGEEILAGDDLYGGTVRLLSRVAPGLGVRVRHVDTTDPAAVAAAISPATRLLLVETPTNPLLRIADLARLAEIAHRRRRAAGGGQLAPLPLPPASAGPGGRPGDPFGHQVPLRPRRRQRRGGGDRRRRPPRAARLPPQRRGDGARAVRQLAAAAGDADAGAARRAPVRDGGADRGVPRRPSSG